MQKAYKNNNILRYTSKRRIPFFLFFSIEGQILPLTGAGGLWYNNENERKQVLGMAEINIYETTLNYNGEQGIIDFDVLLKAFQNAGITINVFNIWDNPSLMTEAVSYTHLDVYKRQGACSVPPTSMDQLVGSPPS